jgi:hypothetical protein
MAESTPHRGYHFDASRFREALDYTATVTGFNSLLIEKDYYCSLVLHDLAELFELGLVFKGGTCLSKVHLDFYRLSEDLDFVISIAATETTSKRRMAISPTKKHLASLCERHDCFKESETLTGHNGSRQYKAVYSYCSIVTGEDATIKWKCLSKTDPLACRKRTHPPGFAFRRNTVQPNTDKRRFEGTHFLRSSPSVAVPS